MTIGIDVSANVQSTVGGVRQVTRALEELRAEVQRVNGDLSKLSDADRTIWEGLERNVKQGLQTPAGAAARRRIEGQTGSADPSLQAILNTPLHIDPREDARLKRNILTSLGGGGRQLPPGGSAAPGATISVAPSQPQSPPPQNAAEPPLAAHGGGMAGALAGAIASGGSLGGYVGGAAGGKIGGMLGAMLPIPGGALIGSALGGVLGGQAGSAVQSGAATQSNRLIDLDHFVRQLGKGADSFEVMNKAVRDTADQLYVSVEEGQRILRGYSAAANLSDPEQIKRGAILAGDFARDNGLDPGRTGDAMGKVRGNTDEAGQRRFAASLAEAFEKIGGNRKEQITLTMADFQDRMAQRNLSAPDITPYTNMLVAMNATGLAGFQGERGMSAIERITASIAANGGGEPGQTFKMRAVMAHIPGMDKHPELEPYLREAGPGASVAALKRSSDPKIAAMFSVLPDSDVTLGQAYSRQLDKYSHGSEAFKGLASQALFGGTATAGLHTADILDAGAPSDPSEMRGGRRFSTPGSRMEQNAADIEQGLSRASEIIARAVETLETGLLNPADSAVLSTPGAGLGAGGFNNPGGMNTWDPVAWGLQPHPAPRPAGSNTNAPPPGSSPK